MRLREGDVFSDGLLRNFWQSPSGEVLATPRRHPQDGGQGDAWQSASLLTTAAAAASRSALSFSVVSHDWTKSSKTAAAASWICRPYQSLPRLFGVVLFGPIPPHITKTSFLHLIKWRVLSLIRTHFLIWPGGEVGRTPNPKSAFWI